MGKKKKQSGRIGVEKETLEIGIGAMCRPDVALFAERFGKPEDDVRKVQKGESIKGIKL